jgi:hypothetical protein
MLVLDDTHNLVAFHYNMNSLKIMFNHRFYVQNQL